MSYLSLLSLRGVVAACVVCSHAAVAAEVPDNQEFIQEYAQCFKQKQSAVRLNCYDSILSLLLAEAESSSVQLRDTSEHKLSKAERRHDAARASEGIGEMSSNEPNYFVWAEPSGDELDDDRHIEFYISQKYPLVDSWFSDFKYTEGGKYEGESIPGRAWIPDRLFFIYNGLYDFYALNDGDRYTSAPVISRKQNPGASLEWERHGSRAKLRMSWFHESNGQTLEETRTDRNGDIIDPENDELSNLEIFEKRNNENGTDFALAGVSRGWDYASIRYEKSWHESLADYGEEWYQWQLEYRWFCDCQGFTSDREDAIWWEEGNDDKIEDFDGLRFMGERVFNVFGLPLLGRVEYKSGVSDLDALTNASWKFTVGPRLKNVRLTAFYFDGYGKEPSTYHLRTQYWGAGLEFR